MNFQVPRTVLESLILCLHDAKRPSLTRRQCNVWLWRHSSEYALLLCPLPCCICWPNPPEALLPFPVPSPKQLSVAGSKANSTVMLLGPSLNPWGQQMSPPPFCPASDTGLFTGAISLLGSSVVV